MVFITQCCKSSPFDVRVLRLGWLGFATWALGVLILTVIPALGLAAPAANAANAAPPQLVQLRTERSDEGVYLSASVAFELPSVVEDALLKGIALYFVVEADILRDRWYWSDQRVANAVRTIRLAYQPLTRRWRVNIGAGVSGSASGLRATFNQNYDTLAEAMSAVQRVTRWKIAETADVRSGSEHKVTFSFKLDLSLLPRPFQIGVAGQRDWSIAIESEQRLAPLTARPVEPPKASDEESPK